jgi:hypothetical protein
MIVLEIFPLYDAAGSQIFLLHFAAGSQILPLHDAAGSQILPPHDAAGSQFGSGESIWQRGIKSKNSERLPRPLKGQLCKKITFIVPSLSSNLQSFFYSPLHEAAGSQTSNSNNSMNLKQKTKNILGCESGTQVDTSDGKN